MSAFRTTREISNNVGYYIPLTDIRLRMLSYSETLNQLSSATWAIAPLDSTRLYSSLVATAGGCVLRDLGRTLVSSSRTFRKVQVVVPNSVSTSGVAGAVGSSYPQMDFLTAYIELGFDGAGSAAPVAQFGR